ncbi:MAG: TolC family protein [Paludibacter sp.]|nr:TolC family protein [Paludibacter sp.]
MKTQFKILCITGCFFLLCMPNVLSQDRYSLHDCLEFALKNNRNLEKQKFDKEKAAEVRKEVLGALMPQINGSAGLNDNLKKAVFVMPNFINNMLPPQAQDPDAPKYMTIQMGTTFSANMGVALNQQLLNFSLFNTLEVAKTAEKMAVLGAESTEEDVINQTATLFYGIQATEYAILQMEKTIDMVTGMVKIMEINYANGLVKKIDVDRLKVNQVNLMTQKYAIQNVAEVQKNLLKLQMGYQVTELLEVEPINLSCFEEKVKNCDDAPFSLQAQTAYQLLMEKLNMAKLQKKSAIYENLPVLSLMLNYQYNGVSDEFFTGPTNYWYPTSMIGLSLKVPIFGGFSRKAKIQGNMIEVLKTQVDAASLQQSLSMAYLNARMKLDDTRRTIVLQRDNQALAEEVLKVAEHNYSLGISSMSDILNASQSLVQAQLSYTNALNDYMKAYIELKKASGNIRDLMNGQ